MPTIFKYINGDCSMSALYIAGIAASQAWDTAGESIDIKGMDISSLEGAVLNWEHESKKSSDYVGKVLKAKKIFSVEDCSNDIELKYWNKCQIPFVFCLGVLFNEYQPSAKEAAGIFEFDAANPDLPPTLGFSIEGAKLNKENGVITHSIARKLTITATSANKTCLAGKVDMSVKPIDPLSMIFKSHSVEIELFPEVQLEKSMPMHPKVPAPAGLKQAPHNEGMSIGQTKSGAHVMSHAKVHAYKNFSAEDHRNAANLHSEAATKANSSKNSKLADHHNQKMKLHNQAAATHERKANRLNVGIKQKHQTIANKPLLGKSMEAGSGLTVPGNKTQGDALQKKNKLTKAEWLERAEQVYTQWDKKDQFEAFMKARMPHLAKGEVKAIGTTLALKKSIDAEKSLETMMGMKLEKSEESHSPKFGETKPHLSHKDMMKLPASEHHKLESHHQEHAFVAEDNGDHANASKHKDAAAMHMNYSVAVSKPQKSPYAPKGSSQLKNDREQKKLRTGYAEQYHQKLNKSDGEESHAKVGDKVHVHIPHENETLEGEVTHYSSKEMGLGGKELPKDDHSVYIKTTKAGKNATRHGVGHTYVMPAKHGKKNGDGMHISPRKDK